MTKKGGFIIGRDVWVKFHILRTKDTLHFPLFNIATVANAMASSSATNHAADENDGDINEMDNGSKSYYQKAVNIFFTSDNRLLKFFSANINFSFLLIFPISERV